MKNLLSKIAKPLLIPALALSMNLKNLDAQKLEFYPFVSFGIGANTYSNFKVYENWQTHFKGFDGNEELKHKKVRPYFDIPLGLDFGFSFKDFSFGLSSRYSIVEAIQKEKRLSFAELYNWDFDYVKIHEVTLKQKIPSIGTYLKFPIGDDKKMCLRGSARKVEINEIKREDIYFTPKSSSDSKCPPSPVDATNDLTREFERTKYKTLLNRMGLEFQSSNEEGTVGIELYYETDWKRVHELGVNFNFYLDKLQ